MGNICSNYDDVAIINENLPMKDIINNESVKDMDNKILSNNELLHGDELLKKNKIELVKKLLDYYHFDEYNKIEIFLSDKEKEKICSITIYFKDGKNATMSVYFPKEEKNLYKCAIFCDGLCKGWINTIGLFEAHQCLLQDRDLYFPKEFTVCQIHDIYLSLLNAIPYNCRGCDCYFEPFLNFFTAEIRTREMNSYFESKEFKNYIKTDEYKSICYISLRSQHLYRRSKYYFSPNFKK